MHSQILNVISISPVKYGEFLNSEVSTISLEQQHSLQTQL